MTIENEPISPETLSTEDLGKALEEAKSAEPSESEESETETVPDGNPKKVETPAKEPEHVETLEEKFAKLEKRLSDKDAFIDRQAAEIGTLRKLVPPEPDKTLHEVNSDNFFEDPVKSVEKITENVRTKLEFEQKARSDALMEELTKRKALTKQVVPDYEENLELIAGILREDQFNDEGIKAFRDNPFAYDVPLLHNLNIRAKQTKKIAELEAKIAGLQGNPKKILDKVEAISRQKPKISGNSSSNQSAEEVDLESLDDKAISKLTDKQLSELLRKSKK